MTSRHSTLVLESRNTRGALLATAHPFRFYALEPRRIIEAEGVAVNMKMKTVFI